MRLNFLLGLCNKAMTCTVCVSGQERTYEPREQEGMNGIPEH